MPFSGSKPSHPFLSLLILCGLIFAGAIIFSIIGVVIAGSIYGFQNLFGSDLLASDINAIKIIQISSSIGMFVLPGLLFGKLESGDWKSYLKLDYFVWTFVLLTILVMICISPIIEFSGTLNQGMNLPDFLKELEDWMKAKEFEMEVLTKKMLFMDGPASLALNLFILAVIPAIGEELIFRGSLQQIFERWFGSPHLAIWISAIIFSSIHVQFFGFLPRLFLGALFGYLMYWSGSIWPAIIGHFLNNAAAVIAAYWLQSQGRSLDELSEPSQIHWLVYVVSVFVGSWSLWFFKRRVEIGLIKKVAD